MRPKRPRSAEPYKHAEEVLLRPDVRTQAQCRKRNPAEGVPLRLVALAVALAGARLLGLLVPAERRIWVNARKAAESLARRRFTIAHEIGYWVCQVLEGR